MIETIKHHNLRAEVIEDQYGLGVVLTQEDDGYCEPQTIVIHPWQLRSVCEHLGIVPTGDKLAHKTIAQMARRLSVLNERIVELRDYMTQFSDHEHADLSKEMTRIDAIALLSEQWAVEVEEYREAAPVSADKMEQVSPAEAQSPIPEQLEL